MPKPRGAHSRSVRRSYRGQPLYWPEYAMTCAASARSPFVAYVATTTGRSYFLSFPPLEWRGYVLIFAQRPVFDSLDRWVGNSQTLWGVSSLGGPTIEHAASTIVGSMTNAGSPGEQVSQLEFPAGPLWRAVDDLLDRASVEGLHHHGLSPLQSIRLRRLGREIPEPVAREARTARCSASLPLRCWSEYVRAATSLCSC